MPFRSKAQQRFMFATRPEMAREFAAQTDFKKLPERAKPKGKGPNTSRKRRKRAEAREGAVAALAKAAALLQNPAVTEDAAVPLSNLPNPEAVDPTNALEDGPQAPPSPMGGPADPMAAAGGGGQPGMPPMPPQGGMPPGAPPPATLPPPVPPQPVPMGAQPPPPPPQPPTMDQVLPGQIARQVADPNTQQGAIAQAQMQPIPGAKVAAWRLARIATLVKRAIALDTVPGGEVAHAMSQLRTAATPDGAGVQPGANMGGPASPGPKRPMFNNWSAVAGAAPVANSTLKRVSPTTGMPSATPGLKSASLRDIARAVSRLNWTAAGALPGAILGGLGTDRLNTALGGPVSPAPGMAGMVAGGLGGGYLGNKAWEHVFEEPKPSPKPKTKTAGLSMDQIRRALGRGAAAGGGALAGGIGGMVGGMAAAPLVGGDPRVLGTFLGGAGAAAGGIKSIDLYNGWNPEPPRPAADEEEEVREKIAACCGMARKIVRPEQRNGKGHFAYRGANAKRLRDDPEYDRYTRGGK